jgi:hypothetical protein
VCGIGLRCGRTGRTLLGVTIADDPATETGFARIRLDRPVLVGNLVAGVLFLSPLAFLSWPLLVIGALYVIAASVFLAAVYAHEVLTRRQEALAWIAPWLVAVALWSVLVAGISFENTAPHYLLGLYGGLLISTLCYLVWQIVALAIRQLVAWRSARPTLPS